jgi:hypothetical protein
VARDFDQWFALLAGRDPQLDRTMLRIIAGVLARDDLPPDVHLIIADALDEATRECLAAGRINEAFPLRRLRVLLWNEAEAAPRRGSFW